MFAWTWTSRLALVAGLGVSVALAAEVGPVKSARSEPETTTITAQKMTVRNQENKAYFEGAVVLTKGTLVVHSDAMAVLFKTTGAPEAKPSGPVPVHPADGQKPSKAGEGGGAAGSRSVNMVEATGRVKIEKDGGTATCQKAVYYEEGEKIILTGEPIAWQKGTKVTGKVITMYLAEDRSVVEGESRVLIQPEPAGGR